MSSWRGSCACRRASRPCAVQRQSLCRHLPPARCSPSAPVRVPCSLAVALQRAPMQPCPSAAVSPAHRRAVNAAPGQHIPSRMQHAKVFRMRHPVSNLHARSACGPHPHARHMQPESENTPALHIWKPSSPACMAMWQFSISNWLRGILCGYPPCGPGCSHFPTNRIVPRRRR